MNYKPLKNVYEKHTALDKKKNPDNICEILSGST